MGSLTLPTDGLVYLDANGLIYSVERIEPYRTLLEPLWEAAQDGAVTIVSSPILIIEALVKPLRDGNMEIEMQYRELSKPTRCASSMLPTRCSKTPPACGRRRG